MRSSWLPSSSRWTRCNHRVPVIAGAGSNDTDHGCALAAKSAACGADALLMVTPYYNKTCQAGLVAHFTAMAEAGSIPASCTMFPPVPGLNIAPGNGTGAEQASADQRHQGGFCGNISQVAKIAALCGDELNIYSGNDDQVVPAAGFGRQGRHQRGFQRQAGAGTTAARPCLTVIRQRPATCSWRCCRCAMHCSAR